MDAKNTVILSFFSLLYRLPQYFFFFFLKYFLLFLVVVCQLGPSGAIFPEFHSTAFLFKNILQNVFNTFLTLTLQWSFYHGHLAANWILMS